MMGGSARDLLFDTDGGQVTAQGNQADADEIYKREPVARKRQDNTAEKNDDQAPVRARKSTQNLFLQSFGSAKQCPSGPREAGLIFICSSDLFK
jgi:hypothetical protein